MADVELRLVDIDEHNWMDVVLLTTEADGVPRVCEQYVASNALSIVQAVFEEEWIIKAIYCGKRAVGFTMYGRNREHGYYEICRIMIDKSQQGRGFGTIALKLVIEDMMDIDGCDAIYLSVNPANARGRHIYESLGFVKTDQRNGQEDIYCLALS